MKLNKNIKFFINYFLSPVLFIWLSWSIYHAIKQQPDLKNTWLQIRRSFHSPLVWNLAAVVLLMLFNWSAEAVKWKLAVKKIQSVSFLKALKAVVSGVSFSVSMPNRVGEYFGRILYMNEGNRLKTISLTIVCSISQIIITLFFGCLGILCMQKKIIAAGLVSTLWIQIIGWGTLAALLILTLFYFRLSWIVKWLDKAPAFRRFAYLISALEEFDATLLFQLLSLSFLRFIIFIVQYYLLFRLFDVQVLWWQGFWAMSVTFLMLAAIPSLTLLELVLRGNIAKMIVGVYSANAEGIVFTTAGIWFINLILPAVAGSLLILGIKKLEKNVEKS